MCSLFLMSLGEGEGGGGGVYSIEKCSLLRIEMKNVVWGAGLLDFMTAGV